MAACTIEVKLVPDGCGLEIDGSNVYSIGNQNVDIMTTNTCSCTYSVEINGETPPVEVCDGDEVVVTIDDPDGDCACTSNDVECVEAAELFVVSKFTKSGKIKLALSSNPYYKKLKTQRLLQKNKLNKLKKNKDKLN